MYPEANFPNYFPRHFPCILSFYVITFTIPELHTNLFAIPSFVRFPLGHPWPPVFERVFLGVLEPAPVAEPALSLHARDHVHLLEINLQPFADALFHRRFRAPSAPGPFHLQPVCKRIIFMFIFEM